MTYFFTSDEHFGHKKILEYCNRPFDNVDEMDNFIINNFNSKVTKNDVTIHAGDFTLWKNMRGIYKKYINRLNGKHFFLKGSHDYWLNGLNQINQIWEKNITFNKKKYYIVVCHYAMRVWARSHYNSFQLYGHSHGNLEPIGKQWDIGVDNNNFFPLSLEEIIEIMKNRPNNFNFIKESYERNKKCF